MRLYPKVIVPGQSFANCKKMVVPNQSMTLEEIIKRFIRKEQLPIGKEGMYEERMGDLEKLENEDITVRMERAAELKKSLAAMQKRIEELEKKSAPPSPPEPEPKPEPENKAE